METSDSLHLTLNEGYNLWSEFYDQDDIPLHLLEEAVVDEALGDVAGLKILDLGCGTGRQTVRLVKRGATVIGVDQSEGMLEKARHKSIGSGVECVHFDLNNGFPFGNDSFDRVVSFLALEHLTNLNEFFSQCRSACRSSGFLYFTAMHPAMVLKGVQARFTESETGRKVYPKSFPYQISDYLNAAIGSGLRLERMTEHIPGADHKSKSQRALKYDGWPLLLTLKFLPNK